MLSNTCSTCVTLGELVNYVSDSCVVVVRLLL